MDVVAKTRPKRTERFLFRFILIPPSTFLARSAIDMPGEWIYCEFKRLERYPAGTEILWKIRRAQYSHRQREDLV
jgi:hypothetical protein